MSHPLISVVVPTFNEEKYISPCISALKNQTFKNFEVIALDKSTDSTPRLCLDAGWKVIKQVKPGISAARAEGFAAADGDIIASTDADSAPDSHWLENIAACFADPSVVCAYGPTYFSEPGLINRFLGFLNTVFLFINRFLKNDQTLGMNFAVRKSAYLKMGGYNTLLPTAEDIDIGYRIRKLGRIVYHPGIKVYTSNRRLARQKLGFFTHHIANFIRIKLTGRASSDFEPIR